LVEDLGNRILAGPAVLPPRERGFRAAGVVAPRQSVGDALEGGIVLDESRDTFLDEGSCGALIAFNAWDREGKDPTRTARIEALAVDHSDPQQHRPREARGLDGSPVLFGFLEGVPDATVGTLDLP
jgi:hypothetical protein